MIFRRNIPVVVLRTIQKKENSANESDAETDSDPLVPSFY